LRRFPQRTSRSFKAARGIWTFAEVDDALVNAEHLATRDDD